MTSENLKMEFEIRRLKTLANELNLKLKKATQQLDARIIKEVKMIDENYKKEIRELKRQVNIAEDMQQRLEKKLESQKLKNEKIINEKDAEILALKRKLIDQAKELELTKKERNQYIARINIDGTTSGIPTSMTPINKKKIIPNTRLKTEKSIGGQQGHKKHKLEKFKDEEINEIEEVTINKCPNCQSKKLKELNESITKDELDYEIKIIKKRYYFKEYECENCHRIVRQNIPNNLKEENQYGNKVQAHVLSLTNIGNVPINKTRRIITGLTSNEINLSEGYIAKLQKRASVLLESFIKDLKEYICTLNVIHWDDTVIFVNGKKACQDIVIKMLFYIQLMSKKIKKD